MQERKRHIRLALTSAIAMETLGGMLLLMKYSPNSPAIGVLLSIEIGSWILFHKFNDNFADWRV